MADNIYSQHMEKLDAKKAEKVQKMFPDLSKPTPLNKGAIGGNLAPEAPPAEAEPDMESAFGSVFQHYTGQDSRFGQMMDDYQGLIAGLREQVQMGFMPEVMAKKQIERFLEDGGNYFAKNKATPLDNPQIQQMMEGALTQGAAAEQAAMQGGEPQGQPQQMPPQGGQPMPPQGGVPPQMQGGM